MNLRHFITFSALFAATQANALPVASVSLDTVTVSPSAPYTGEDGLLTDYSNAAASPWMKKLQSVAQGGGTTFRILQIGDSHTAGDFFTDTLRKRLQKAWGDGAWRPSATAATGKASPAGTIPETSRSAASLPGRATTAA